MNYKCVYVFDHFPYHFRQIDVHGNGLVTSRAEIIHFRQVHHVDKYA